MPAAGHAPAVLALLLVAAVGAARAQDSVLVLRRDWTPSTCSLANVTCREHPDSFSIDSLFIANWTTGEARTACTDKPPLAVADFEAAGLSLADVGCAFQNYDPDTTSLEPVWNYQWEQFGKCTAASTAVDFFRLGLELDQRFPLPQDIASMTTGAQLVAAIQTAFGAAPYVVCDSTDGLLLNIQICFDPASGDVTNCPLTTALACNGPLRVPRTGRGAGFPSCQGYYPPSPVSALLAANRPPAQLGGDAAPAPAPTAAQAPAVAPAAAPSPAPAPEPGAASPPPTPPSPSPFPPPSPAPSPPPAPSPSSAPSPAPSPSSAPPTSSPPPPSPADQPPPELVPLDTAGASSGSDSGGTSTGAKVGALVGGIVGGMLLGAAAIGVSYRAYTRCGTGGGKSSAGSSAGPLLEAGSGSDTSRQTLPMYNSSLPPVRQ